MKKKSDDKILIEGLIDYHRILKDAILKQQENATTYMTIRWERPNVTIQQQFSYLGVEETDPNEYIKQYGSTLVENASVFLPDEVKHFQTPIGEVLAADYNRSDSTSTDNEYEYVYTSNYSNLNNNVQHECHTSNRFVNQPCYNFYPSNSYYNIFNQY